jgi:hypothetical protein
MATVTNLDINIRGKTDQLTSALTKASEQVKGFAASTTTLLGGVASRLTGLGGVLKEKIAGALALIPGGGVLATMFKAATPLINTAWDALKGVAKTLTGILTLSPTTFLGGLKNLASSVTSVLGVVTALVAAFVGMGLSAMPGIVSTSKAAKALGVSFEDMATFAYKSRLDVEELAPMLAKLQKNLAQPSREVVAALHGIGVNAAELRGMKRHSRQISPTW